MEELVSVIIPVYKVEDYLDRCVQSVVNQTYKNIEIILVDDGSPDNCPAMCDEWAEKDSRIKVIHKKNGGLSDARNYGLDAADGEYISFVDSDDYVADHMIQKLYDTMQTDKSDLAMTNYLCFDDNGSNFNYENKLPIQNGIINKEEAFKTLFGDYHWHYVIACSKLYKRFLFDGFRFPYGKLHEDLHTTHLIFDKCSLISLVHEPLYYYYQNNSSITHVYSIKRLDAVDAYISRFDFFYKRQNYYCAAMNVKFMQEKLLTAQLSLDLKDKTAKEKIHNYRRIYKKLLKKVIFKKIEGVDKLELLTFLLGVFPFRVYRYIKRIISKII